MIKDKSIQDETLDKEEFSICTFASSSIDTSMPWPPLCRASILFVKTQEEKEHSNILKIEKKNIISEKFLTVNRLFTIFIVKVHLLHTDCDNKFLQLL